MTDRLSSDILEQQFGPTELKILWQDAISRAICTKVIASGKVLELSKVTFLPEGANQFPDIHQEVVAGSSMGKAFAGHDIPFKRQARVISSDTQIPYTIAEQFGSHGSVTIVGVAILVGSELVPYADILEVYSPSVVWPETVGEASPATSAQLVMFDELLSKYL